MGYQTLQENNAYVEKLHTTLTPLSGLTQPLDSVHLTICPADWKLRVNGKPWTFLFQYEVPSFTNPIHFKIVANHKFNLYDTIFITLI